MDLIFPSRWYGVFSVEHDYPLRVGIESVLFSALRVVIVPELNPLLRETVPVNHGESDEIISYPSFVKVIHISKEYKLIVGVSFLCLYILAFDIQNPFPSEVSDVVRKHFNLIYLFILSTMIF